MTTNDNNRTVGIRYFKNSMRFFCCSDQIFTRYKYIKYHGVIIRTMNTIYYQTKTKFNNTGDALINKALIEMLRNYGQLKCNCSKEIPEYLLRN